MNLSKTVPSLLLLISTPALASTTTADLTQSTVGYLCLGIFAFSYLLVMLEEKTHMRKSKPVVVAAGLIWAVIAFTTSDSVAAEEAARHNLLEFAELFLFLLVAMTYVCSLEERRVFDVLRAWIVRRGYSYRQIFWITGALAFMLSPIADNLTTALIMCAVLLTVAGPENPRVVTVGCINIVVAANAGGAFSPFGDITTLMVWQKGVVPFQDFFHLFLPSVVNWLIPAVLMVRTLSRAAPDAIVEHVRVKRGGYGICVFFAITIVLAVSFHTYLHLPPVLGMLTGLGLLQLYAYYLKMTFRPEYIARKYGIPVDSVRAQPFDIFDKVSRSEWDTLIFFYGVVMAVGGLGFLGYLNLASELSYNQLGPTTANILVGILSAIVDNIPVMFAVLSMNPDMDLTQWLLVTLTAGVGGSLLSIGSAAGVALMGQSRGLYTFGEHLKWSWAIALGYGGSIIVHLLLSQYVFNF